MRSRPAIWMCLVLTCFSTYAQAQQTMEQKLGPILQQIVKERGANLVLDKQAVVFAPAAGGFDITCDCIKRLDQQMPALKLNFNVSTAAAKK